MRKRLESNRQVYSSKNIHKNSCCSCLYRCWDWLDYCNLLSQGVELTSLDELQRVREQRNSNMIVVNEQNSFITQPLISLVASTISVTLMLGISHLIQLVSKVHQSSSSASQKPLVSSPSWAHLLDDALSCSAHSSSRHTVSTTR